ncbi:MAG: zinc ribbon domain-containing protein [Clostridia bacterium]|nr:zinc ribbon domain-containing protein [Clostridia bacterium]
MERKCLKCGADIADGTKFCTSCGTPVPEIPAPAPAPAAPAQPAYAPQPAYQQPAYNQGFAPQKPVSDENKPCSIWAYLGAMFLFAIPCVGLIALIIMCFAPKNKSLKNYAIATLIFTIIISVISCIIGFIFGAAIMSGLSDKLDDMKDDFGDQLTSSIYSEFGDYSFDTDDYDGEITYNFDF